MFLSDCVHKAMSLKAQSFLNPNNRVEFKVCVLISDIVAVGMGSGNGRGVQMMSSLFVCLV